MSASFSVSKKRHDKTKISRETKKSSETDKQRTLNIKEAGTIGKRLFPCFDVTWAFQEIYRTLTRPWPPKRPSRGFLKVIKKVNSCRII